MIYIVENKQLQVRKTAEDVNNSQDNLYLLILCHINHNSCLTYAEKMTFLKLVKDAVGSFGNYEIMFTPKTGYPVFRISILGLSYILIEANTPIIKLRPDIGLPSSDFQIKELWYHLKQKLVTTVFSEARREALHMSAETDASYSKPTSFVFSAQNFDVDE